MRVRVKLVKSVATLAGSWQSFTGELDPQTGICWLDEEQRDYTDQKVGRRVPAGMGILIATGATVMKLRELPAAAAKPKAAPAKDPPAAA